MKLRYAELFAGLGIGSLAIKKAFPDAECAFYSEIEKNRCALLAKMHPGVKNIGDIDFLDIDRVPKFDLIIGGSPCKDLSIARSQREGLDGYHSGLFYQFLELIREKKPRYFLLENVASMRNEDRDEISRCLGVKPVEINSRHFTGQSRKRLYWFNWDMLPLPQDLGNAAPVVDRGVIPTQDLEEFFDPEALHAAYDSEGKIDDPLAYLKKTAKRWQFIAWSRSTRYKSFVNYAEYNAWKAKHPKVDHTKKESNKSISISYVEQRIKIDMDANTLLTGNGCTIFSSKNLVRLGNKARLLTPKECARLQGIPDTHLEGWKASAAYKAIGDAFTLDSVVHIMNSLKASL